jgi:hypothetical protein
MTELLAFGAAHPLLSTLWLVIVAGAVATWRPFGGRS